MIWEKPVYFLHFDNLMILTQSEPVKDGGNPTRYDHPFQMDYKKINLDEYLGNPCYFYVEEEFNKGKPIKYYGRLVSEDPTRKLKSVGFKMFNYPITDYAFYT